MDEESAVLIVGGEWIHIGEGGLVVVQSAELFGCEDSVDAETGEYVGKPVDDYPVGIYATGGIYYEQSGVDEEGDGQVVVCGGWGCSSPSM